MLTDRKAIRYLGRSSLLGLVFVSCSVLFAAGSTSGADTKGTLDPDAKHSPEARHADIPLIRRHHRPKEVEVRSTGNVIPANASQSWQPEGGHAAAKETTKARRVLDVIRQLVNSNNNIAAEERGQSHRLHTTAKESHEPTGRRNDAEKSLAGSASASEALQKHAPGHRLDAASVMRHVVNDTGLDPVSHMVHGTGETTLKSSVSANSANTSMQTYVPVHKLDAAPAMRHVMNDTDIDPMSLSHAASNASQTTLKSSSSASANASMPTFPFGHKLDQWPIVRDIIDDTRLDPMMRRMANDTRELTLKSSYSGRNYIPQTIAYIRIQKTGSTTFGEYILPEMAKLHGQQAPYSKFHLEYYQAKQVAPGAMVTLLRDPVERFMSEFAMAYQGPDREFLFQDQWDIHDRDIQWLKDVQATGDTREAMRKYLQFKFNPTRNRQALYLLGFHRVGCDRSCCGICSEDDTGYPAMQYDWEKDHASLLELAKQRLTELTSYGITDCLAESMAPVAQALGWDVAATQSLARSVQERKQNKEQIMSALGLTSHLKGQSLLQGRVTHWRHMLEPELIQEIKRASAVDVELVEFARKKLHDDHGILCPPAGDH
eukprot:gb/GFBE01054736.1/.p1 GENE.gb/GFBE01054736.1/~~gb/GFBE01054736.1/.p1  ORF type:complete len:602 (+),score=93.59 gb/GFBE01054736.1/:1-1806(+)